MKEMKVDAIRNGTVIDHIPAGKALQVIRIMRIEYESPVSLGMHLCSGKLERKDIIKVENHELSSEEVNSIALIAPRATVSIIRDFEVAEKWIVTLPETVEKVAECPNPLCITKSEPLVSRFQKTPGQDYVLRCYYCEKSYSINELPVRNGASG